MPYRKFALVVCGSFFVCLTSFAQTVHTPAPGSQERQAIMDALRVPAQKDLGFSVIFKVDLLHVAGNWAFTRVSPTLPNGAEIDYSRTKYRKQVDLGMFDPQGEALLRREGDQWKLVEWRFGATDTASPIWAEKYRLPKSLLK